MFLFDSFNAKRKMYFHQSPYYIYFLNKSTMCNLFCQVIIEQYLWLEIFVELVKVQLKWIRILNEFKMQPCIWLNKTNEENVVCFLQKTSGILSFFQRIHQIPLDIWFPVKVNSKWLQVTWDLFAVLLPYWRHLTFLLVLYLLHWDQLYNLLLLCCCYF